MAGRDHAGQAWLGEPAARLSTSTSPCSATARLASASHRPTSCRPQPAPLPKPEEAATQESPSWLTWTLSFLGILILVGGGIYLISKLAQSRKRVVDHELKKRQTASSATDFGVDRYRAVAQPARRAASPLHSPLMTAPSPKSLTASSTRPAPLSTRLKRKNWTTSTSSTKNSTGKDMEPVTAPVARQASAVRQTSGYPRHLYRAHYQAGVIDFDQSFKIVDPGNLFVGECGIRRQRQKRRSFKDNPENADRLDVWLALIEEMEKSLGNRTRVFASEYALDRNLEPALIANANDPPPIIAQPGVSFSETQGRPHPRLASDREWRMASKSGADAGVFQNVRLEMTVRSRLTRTTKDRGETPPLFPYKPSFAIPYHRSSGSYSPLVLQHGKAVRHAGNIVTTRCRPSGCWSALRNVSGGNCCGSSI